MNPSLYPPIGKLVDVGGHRLHIYATGEEGPTVVLEAGGACWSLDWYPVQSAVAGFARTCSYDRAGLGWSEAGPKPRSSGRIAEELHALLDGAGMAKPYVLVGASVGGHAARLFAARYADEVAGMVLLDARHEAINERMPPAWRRMETAGIQMYRAMLLMSRLKLLKVMGKLGGQRALPPVLSKLPAEMRPMYLEVGFQPKYFQGNLDEAAACAESDEQVRAAGSLGAIPLVVVRHGLPEMFGQMPADQAARAEQVWQVLQGELVGLSTNGRMLVAEQSGHRIQMDEPELVARVVREVVEAVREG